MLTRPPLASTIATARSWRRLLAASAMVTVHQRLTEREREVVRARFGFDAPAEQLSEVGERLGVSAERVRQIEEHALAKLRSA